MAALSSSSGYPALSWQFSTVEKKKSLSFSAWENHADSKASPCPPTLTPCLLVWIHCAFSHVILFCLLTLFPHVNARELRSETDTSR